ncbi:oxidoreductase-like domain-containing protein [Pseudoxanthomonas suwonensis]
MRDVPRPCSSGGRRSAAAAPEKPLPSECCESGCPICVYDLYAEALDEYRQALAAWQQRHPGVDPGTL